MKNDKRINVTKTFLPPIEKYEAYLKRIWDSDQLTNQGPLLKEFESKVSKYLSVNRLHFVTNGTLALQLSIKALGINGGEIITTPFSYVATTSSILWENCRPIFVDIDPKTLCIDPNKIESAITPDTKAIMPVHVFGNACDVEAIGLIAKKHNLKIIYDAAHAFGVEYDGRSLLSYGDISVCSFHATKLFHTIEGGGVVANDEKLSEQLELIKRFGHNGDDHYMLGTNAKASEFQAAMGLCNIEYLPQIIEKRKKISELYDSKLSGLAFHTKTDKKHTRNYSYYPILLRDTEERASVKTALEQNNIFPRRYFYPSLNKLPYLNNEQSCPISENIAGRILCLPLYDSLSPEEANLVANIVNLARHA